MYSIIWPAGATQNGCKNTENDNQHWKDHKIHTFVFFHLHYFMCIYTYTVRTYIIMSEMKICIIFPFNGLYIIPLPLSASVQAHATLCNRKGYRLFIALLKPRFSFILWVNLILRWYFPQVFQRQLCARSAARSVSQVFFFLFLTSPTWRLRSDPGDGRRELPACSSSGTSHKRCSCRGRRCLQLHDHTHH